MKYNDRFDSLIRYHCERLKAPFDWRWVKAQIQAESNFRPDATSEVGARGLMQLMPDTDMEIDGDLDGFDIEGNLDNGIRYLAEQYEKLAEIPNSFDRLRCALAAYNGGRGYVNAALALGRIHAGQPEDFRKWKKSGSPPGPWQTWSQVVVLLSLIDVRGVRPDHRQMTEYVDRITENYIRYTTPEEIYV